MDAPLQRLMTQAKGSGHKKCAICPKLSCGVCDACGRPLCEEHSISLPHTSGKPTLLCFGTRCPLGPR